MPKKLTECPFCQAGSCEPIEIDLNAWAVTCHGCKAIGPHAHDESSAVMLWGTAAGKQKWQDCHYRSSIAAAHTSPCSTQ